MKQILQAILFYFSRIIIRRYKPVIIAVTGSVGKTSAKEAIYTVLKTKFRVRKSEFNYNNEIGVPLAIFGLPHPGKNIFRWFALFLLVIADALVKNKSFPEMLILEMGVDRPGDMKHLIACAPPLVGVITEIGEIPVHVEFFSGPKEVADEKANIIKFLPIEGFAVLNADDEVLDDMPKKTKAHALRFGFSDDADLKITNFELSAGYDETLKKEIPRGVHFKIEYQGKVIPVKLPDVFGKPAAYAAAVGALVGLIFKMNLIEISSALLGYVPPPGRLRLLRGIKNSFILDDTYNSSPEALHAALDTLRDLPGKRKIAVLGDMLELGTYSEGAHRAAGDMVSEIADALLTVGARAKFIADEAMQGGIENKKVMDKKYVSTFDRSEDAGKALQDIIQEGDLILVKGSQGIRMERVVEEIMAEPEKAGKLLVRQSAYWKGKF